MFLAPFEGLKNYKEPRKFKKNARKGIGHMRMVNDFVYA